MNNYLISEILLITGNIVTLQGYGKKTVKFIHNGQMTEREIDFTHKPLQAIKL